MSKLNDCSHIEVLISGYLDGELTQQESQKVAVHLAQCKVCQSSYQELKKLQTAIGKTPYAQMEAEQLNAILSDLTANRVERASWILITIGLVILLVFAIYHFWFDTSMAWYSKLAISLLWGGGIGLFVSVLRQRWISKKNDKYRKVEL